MEENITEHNNYIPSYSEYNIEDATLHEGTKKDEFEVSPVDSNVPLKQKENDTNLPHNIEDLALHEGIYPIEEEKRELEQGVVSPQEGTLRDVKSLDQKWLTLSEQRTPEEQSLESFSPDESEIEDEDILSVHSSGSVSIVHPTTKSQGVQVPEYTEDIVDTPEPALMPEKYLGMRELEPKRKVNCFSKLKKIFQRKEKVAIIEEKPEEILDIMSPRASYRFSLEYGMKTPIRDTEKRSKSVKITSDDDESKSVDYEGKRRPSAPYMLDRAPVDETLVPASNIGVCLRRGFRPDHLALSGDMCFLVHPEKYTESGTLIAIGDEMITFSERDQPLDFLLALGLGIDEAAEYTKDPELSGRLKAAMIESKVWANSITRTQGTLLFLLAYKAKPKIMRYYLLLVEAITNKRINNAVQLDDYLIILGKAEDGYFSLNSVVGSKLMSERDMRAGEKKIETSMLKRRLSFLEDILSDSARNEFPEVIASTDSPRRTTRVYRSPPPSQVLSSGVSSESSSVSSSSHESSVTLPRISSIDVIDIMKSKPEISDSDPSLKII